MHNNSDLAHYICVTSSACRTTRITQITQESSFMTSKLAVLQHNNLAIKDITTRSQPKLCPVICILKFGFLNNQQELAIPQAASQCIACFVLYLGAQRAVLQIEFYLYRRRRRLKQKGDTALTDTTNSEQVTETVNSESDLTLVRQTSATLTAKSIEEMLSKSVGVFNSQALSDQSHMDAAQQNLPQGVMKKIGSLIAQQPCDCGCVTQSVKQGRSRSLVKTLYYHVFSPSHFVIFMLCDTLQVPQLCMSPF